MEDLKKAVIWGAGNLGASKLLCELLGLRYEITAYCDSDQTKWGKAVNGYLVKSHGKRKLYELFIKFRSDVL